jgi:hypothetical protein
MIVYYVLTVKRQYFIEQVSIRCSTENLTETIRRTMEEQRFKFLTAVIKIATSS